MKKIQLTEDILVYQFESTSDSLIGINIAAIFNEKKEFLLIDTGYQHNIKEVLSDLDGYHCTHVINTHYHPDHTYGLFELDNVIKIGSSNGKNTLKEFELENYLELHPTIEVDEELEYNFGSHVINMKQNIGHSKCGLIIDVDDMFLFVGDDVMITNAGEPIFPYLTLKDIDYPIQAMEKIKNNAQGKTVIPAHGDIMDNDDKINKELDIRVMYFNYIRKNLILKDFEKETGIVFKGRVGWHKHNTDLIN